MRNSIFTIHAKWNLQSIVSFLSVDSHLSHTPPTSDDGMVGYEIPRWILFICRTTYLRWLQPYSSFAFLLSAKYLRHFLIGFRIGGVVR